MIHVGELLRRQRDCGASGERERQGWRWTGLAGAGGLGPYGRGWMMQRLVASRLRRVRLGEEPVVRRDAVKHGGVVAAHESRNFGVAVAAVWVVANEPP